MARQDFTADGSSDILWRNSSTDVLGYWDMFQGSVWAWVGLGTVNQGWIIVDTGDYTGDGYDDILWRNTSSGAFGYYDIFAGSISWIGLGTINPGWSVQSHWGNSDFDGNGTDDILWRHTSGATGYYAMASNGSITWVDFGNISTQWNIVAYQGDFTGDNSDDILWQNSSTGELGFWDMFHGSVFDWHALGTVNPGWSIIQTADFTGDGIDDILWRNTSGQIGFYGMGSSITWHDFGVISNSWQVVGVNDYTGDGVEDILWRNSSTGDIGYWDMNAGGSIGSWVGLGTYNTDWYVN